ncbi:MAG: hypothetical protein HYY56_05345 [Candidatus Omnitrophica bacterium]|nr:hypothetical protein [Candidatus Omnitrophota bacterium]
MAEFMKEIRFKRAISGRDMYGVLEAFKDTVLTKLSQSQGLPLDDATMDWIRNRMKSALNLCIRGTPWRKEYFLRMGETKKRPKRNIINAQKVYYALKDMEAKWIEGDTEWVKDRIVILKDICRDTRYWKEKYFLTHQKEEDVDFEKKVNADEIAAKLEELEKVIGQLEQGVTANRLKELADKCLRQWRWRKRPFYVKDLEGGATFKQGTGAQSFYHALKYFEKMLNYLLSGGPEDKVFEQDLAKYLKHENVDPNMRVPFLIKKIFEAYQHVCIKRGYLKEPIHHYKAEKQIYRDAIGWKPWVWPEEEEKKEETTKQG